MAELNVAVLGCGSPHDVPALVLAPIAAMLGADAATALDFAREPDGTVRLARHWAVGLPPGVHESYAERWWRHDPMVGRADGAGPVQTLRLAGLEPLLAAAPAPSAARYYREFWCANRFQHMLAIVARPAGLGHDLVVALHRRRGGRPFGASEEAAARGLGSTAGAVLAGLIHGEAAARARAVAHAIADAIAPLGVTVLDADGPVFRSRHAVCQSARTPRRAVAAGELTVVLSGDPAVHPEDRATLPGLTAREVEVAALVAAGLSNGEIAAELGVAGKTVENHLSAIFAKAGVESRGRLARLITSRRFADGSARGRR